MCARLSLYELVRLTFPRFGLHSRVQREGRGRTPPASGAELELDARVFRCWRCEACSTRPTS